MLLEFPCVTYRWDDWDVSFAGGTEFSFIVLSYIHIHRIEMTICIVDAQVPDALMAMLGNMMEIKAQVQTMISRQGQVVGDGIDK